MGDGLSSWNCRRWSGWYGLVDDGEQGGCRHLCGADQQGLVYGGHGITTEVFYPRLDIPNMQDMQYIVTDGSTFVDLERDATRHEISMPTRRRSSTRSPTLTSA